MRIILHTEKPDILHINFRLFDPYLVYGSLADVPATSSLGFVLVQRRQLQISTAVHWEDSIGDAHSLPESPTT